MKQNTGSRKNDPCVFAQTTEIANASHQRIRPVSNSNNVSSSHTHPNTCGRASQCSCAAVNIGEANKQTRRKFDPHAQCNRTQSQVQNPIAAKYNTATPANPAPRCAAPMAASAAHSHAYHSPPGRENEYGSTRGTAKFLRMPSPVRICQPVSESRNNCSGAR